MASQGPLSAGTGADDASVGTASWSNPTRIVSSNESFAQAGATNTTTHYLKATQFGFTIPSGATIDGIVMEYERKKSGGTCTTLAANLVKAGAVVGTNLGSGAWPTTDAYASHGSSTELWGTTWTDSEINASNFGCVLQCNFVSTVIASVDHIRMTVHYTEAGSSFSHDASGVGRLTSSATARLTVAYLGSGAVRTAASATAGLTLPFAGSGVVRCGGAASTALQMASAASGRLVLGGTTAVSSGQLVEGSGVVRLSGTADASLTVPQTSRPRRSLMGIGV